EHRRPRDGEGLPQGRHVEVLRRRHLPKAQAPRAPEGGQEAHEAGRARRGPAGGVPRGARAGRRLELELSREPPPAARRTQSSSVASTWMSTPPSAREIVQFLPAPAAASSNAAWSIPGTLPRT